MRAAGPGSAVTICVGGSPAGGPPPPTLDRALALCSRLDNSSRLLDDDAVAPLPAAVWPQLLAGLRANAGDPWVAGALLCALAKLSALQVRGWKGEKESRPLVLSCTSRPVLQANAGAALSAGALPLVLAAAADHPADPHVALASATFVFNAGRDVSASETLLLGGAAPAMCSAARRWLRLRASTTGVPLDSAWAPPGLAASIAEAPAVPGDDAYAAARNAPRPAVALLAVNVCINLSCYVPPPPSAPAPPGVPPAALAALRGRSAAEALVDAGCIPALSEVVLAHLAEPAVTTAVLNCASNIAYRDPVVQVRVCAWKAAAPFGRRIRR